MILIDNQVKPICDDDKFYVRIQRLLFDLNNLDDRMRIVVGEKHRVYSARGSDLKPSSYNMINLLLKSSGFESSVSNLEKESCETLIGLFCGILNQTTENIFSLGNCSELVKSSSLVTNTLSSDLENSANLPFLNPLGLNIASKPCSWRNQPNLTSTFSSNKNLIFERNTELDIISSPHKIGSIMQCCLNMFFCKGGKGCENFIYINSSFKHLKNLPDHDSGAFEGWLSVANLSICNNIFINLDSHNNVNDEEIYKDSAFWVIWTFKLSVMVNGLNYAELYTRLSMESYTDFLRKNMYWVFAENKGFRVCWMPKHGFWGLDAHPYARHDEVKQ